MIKHKKHKNSTMRKTFVAFFCLFFLTIVPATPAFAVKVCGGGPQPNGGGTYPSTNTAIDLGCTGKGNPIMDMLFGVIRFLAAGVGVVIIGSTIFAGVQYATARDSPEAVQKAKGRIISNLMALLLYIFGYALLNFLIPGGFFNR